MSGVIEHGPILEWFKSLLEKGTARPIGDAKAPVENPSKDDFPYAIIYEIPGGGTWGPFFGQPEQNADLVFQVSSFGLRKDSARWMADRVRQTICGRTTDGSFEVTLAPPPPYEVADRVQSGAGPGTGAPSGEDETQFTPEVYTFPERYTIRVTQGDPHG